jgi:hypothetical protein
LPVSRAQSGTRRSEKLSIRQGIYETPTLRQKQAERWGAPPIALQFCSWLDRLLFVAALQQVGTHKRLQVAIEHPVHVADFHFGAVVLSHAVGG